MNEENKLDMNIAILDYIEENQLLENKNIKGMKVFNIIEEHPDRKSKRVYQFSINGLSHFIEVKIDTIGKGLGVGIKDIASPKEIMEVLKEDVNKNKNLIPFLYILFKLNVQNVMEWAKESQITRKHKALINIKNSKIGRINSIDKSIINLRQMVYGIDMQIRSLEDLDAIEDHNLSEESNMNNNILTYLRASHKLSNSYKITISDWYYNEEHKNGHDEYIYEHDRNYTFKVNGMDYKIKINKGIESFPHTLSKTMRVYNEEKRLLDCISNDMDKEPDIIPLLVAIFDIDVNKLRNGKLIELYERKNSIESEINKLENEKANLNESISDIKEQLRELEYQLGNRNIDNSVVHKKR